MFKKNRWSALEVTFVLLAGLMVLLVYGAIPFVTVPTLGQAIWSMGWAESFSHGNLLELYARDFGISAPAPIAFGLAGAWPASLFIRLGLHAGDAYCATVASWLILSMFSAFRIAETLGASRKVALLAAVTWLTMPVVWMHAGYSMLSLGIALLPFYFRSAFRLLQVGNDATGITPGIILYYFSSTIISIFMDGYTFMMFAVGASIFLLRALLSQPTLRHTFLRVAVPVHLLSFSLAYVLFSVYIGKSTFDAHDIGFFRSWGLDLSFLAIPTRGTLWLPDVLGLSMVRTDARYFGDESIWTTTFALPLLSLAT